MNNILNKNNLDKYNFYSNMNFENLIIDFISKEGLTHLCKNILINNDDHAFSYYNYGDKTLNFNYNKLNTIFLNKFNSQYIANLNLLRILYHEIIHIHQFKMIENENIKASIFLKEIQTYSIWDPKFLPMETNADILSSLKVIDIIEEDNILANQILWTYNIINDKYKNGNPADLIKFNNKQIYDDLYEKLIYGILFNQEDFFKIINPYLENNKYKDKIYTKIKKH